jgi:hypothetical protein
MDTFLNIIFKLNGIEHTSLFRTQSTINAFFNINMGSESGFGIIIPGLQTASVIMHIGKNAAVSHSAVT